MKPMKETLTGIDRALAAKRVAHSPSQDKDITFGIYRRGDGELVMGKKLVQIDENKKTLTVNGTVYDLTSDLYALIMLQHIEYSRIRQVLLDHTLHGNISICLGKWLYLGKR